MTADQTTKSSSSSSSGTTGRTASQPERPSVTAVEKPKTQPGESSPGADMELLGMFSPSVPSNAESVFTAVDIGIDSMNMDIDMGTDVSTSFEKPKEVALHIPTDLGIEDDVTWGDLVMEPWVLEPQVPVTPADIYASTCTSEHALESVNEKNVSDSNTCQCLHRVVILVDEIESIVDRNGLESLDGALAAHKEALGCGFKMLDCLTCTSRVENMIILTLMVDKLVRMCGYISEACCTGLRVGGSECKTGSGKALEATPLLSLQNHTSTNDHGLDYRELSQPANSTTRVYSIDSPNEYLFMVAGILRFQLQELFNLTRQLREVSVPLASDTMSRRLAACNEAVKEMLRKEGLTPFEATEGMEV
ncbi:hypothetical protein GGR58DRAFT_506571 [Xylaria digitata]|nr:hypothetical protein GGR58DRAFT_506571 [Xylaria digitata]